MKTRRELDVGLKSAGAAIPLPRKEEKRLVQAEVNADLWRAVEDEMRKDEATIRSVMEYGFKVYLLQKNPSAAKALGIQTNEK